LPSKQKDKELRLVVVSYQEKLSADFCVVVVSRNIA